MRNGINKLAKVLTVSIDKEKVKVFTEKEDLLITNNNIQAYLRLYDEFYVKAQFVGKKTLEDYII